MVGERAQAEQGVQHAKGDAFVERPRERPRHRLEPARASQEGDVVLGEPGVEGGEVNHRAHHHQDGESGEASDPRDALERR